MHEEIYTYKLTVYRASLIAQLVKNLPAMQESPVWAGSGRSPGEGIDYPLLGFPCGSAGKESTCNVRDEGSIPGWGRSPGEEKDYPLPVFWPGEFRRLYSPWVTKSRTRLGKFYFHFQWFINFYF